MEGSRKNEADSCQHSCGNIFFLLFDSYNRIDYFISMRIQRRNHEEKLNLPCMDDRETFTAVQIERYLKRKTLHRFCSEAEKDVILQIIDDYWKEFREMIQLSQMDTDHKITAFYRYTIVFPYFVAEEEQLINVDFKKKARINGNDLCPCGSGRPLKFCCGRITSMKYLLNGPK